MPGRDIRLWSPVRRASQPECVNVDRWTRWLARAIGAAALVVAAGVLAVTVQVHAAGGSRSCGSAWDVIAGRSGWQQWWALDQADAPSAAPWLRTEKCPGAVNAHVVEAAALGVGAVAALSAAAFIGSRSRKATPTAAPARRLRMLGRSMTVLGVLLSVGGLVGIALLVANPDAPLFLYVNRQTVVLLGLVLLLPAVLLIVLGRSASLLADHLGRDGLLNESS